MANNNQEVELSLVKHGEKVESEESEASVGRLADAAAELEASLELEDQAAPLINLIGMRYESAKTKRERFDDPRWLRAYRNWRGLYGPDMQWKESEKSRVFVKVTKLKVMAAYSQLVDVLFSIGKFPLSVDRTKVPEGIAEYAHIDQTGQEPDTTLPNPGFPGDGNDLKPGAGFKDILGSVAKLFGGGDQSNVPWKEGQSPDPNVPTIQPADIAAKNMEKIIIDQLDATDAKDHIRKALLEMAMLGTGIVKGPFTEHKTINRWILDESDPEGKARKYSPKDKIVPTLSWVSVWDFFPDPNAKCKADMGWCVERHTLNDTQLRELTKMPFFNKEKIEECIEMGYNYNPEHYESILRSLEGSEELSQDRYEVLEYWGTIEKSIAEAIGMEIPEDMEELDSLQINAWVCHNKLLRATVNPFKPIRIPYHICPYEENLYSIFGVGVAENMEDAQMMINGFTRMAVDNLSLAGNLVLDVDENSLVPGQAMELYAGKIFRRQTGQAGQSIYPIQFPNVAPANIEMVRYFRQFADEETGLPSYSHGQTGVTGTGRTAAGLSMLLSAAATSIKTVIHNIDDHILQPVGEGFFSWNMQFNEEDDIPIEGDLEIKARGTSSLMQKEVRTQRLMTFLQVGSNQLTAPFIKWNKLLREIAEELEIDPDEIINDPETAAIYSQVMGVMNANQAGPSQGAQGIGGPPAMGESGPVPAGANPQDQRGTGGGNIGVGTTPMPGEDQYSQGT